MDIDEVLLITQAKGGSQKAYTEIFNKYKLYVRKLAFDYVKNTETTDDIVSTVFIKVFKKLDSFTTNDSFRAWLRRITITTSIDYLRSNKNEKLISSIDDTTSNHLSAVNSVEDIFITSEKHKHIANIISKLPKRQQEIVKLYYYEGYLYRDISKKLAKPLGTIQSDLCRAKRKLKQLLTQSNQLNNYGNI